MALPLLVLAAPSEAVWGGTSVGYGAGTGMPVEAVAHVVLEAVTAQTDAS